MPSLAITYTIKNEARLLPDAIYYHRALGCSRFYVFLDGTTDGMREWLEDQPDVTLADSIDPDGIGEPPTWIDWARKNHAEWMDVRKMLNIYVAAQRARADGFDWLATIDPDELIEPSGRDPRQMLDLEGWLAAIPDRFDQILMPNLDVLPTAGDGISPFDKRYFLNRLGATEWIWLQLHRIATHTLRHPRAVARFDQFFFELALGKRNPRVLRHPETGQRIPHGYFLSYSNYKAMIRVDRAAAFRPYIHSWVGDRGPKPRSIKSGYVLHFDIVDTNHLVAKFRQRKGQQEHERILFYPRWALGQMALAVREPLLERFFVDSVSVSDPKRLDYLIRKRTVVRINAPADIIYSNRTLSPGTV